MARWGWGLSIGGTTLGCALALAAERVEAQQQSPQTLPQLNVTATRLEQGTTDIVGTSTTVITAEEIARSPSLTLQDILSREPGIQVTNLFGGVNGARSVVDMRGFGAAAASNTLVLVNGRRITDLDIVGIDFAAIPKESIERIEITRGNSGVVLYGDGAVGGTINIITKTGAGLPPKLRLEAAMGSFRTREQNASFSGSNGPWSASVHGNGFNSDGYRDNNDYRQYNGVGDFRYTTDQFGAYLNLSTDDQHLGLPGARRVQPNIGLNQLVTDPQGATTPFDWAERRGYNGTAGFTLRLAPGAELIVDGGVRHKIEKAQYHGTFADLAAPDYRAAVDTRLTTTSFTPRLNLQSNLFGLPWRAIGGFDYYKADYHSDRPQHLGELPVHTYDLSQRTTAGYWQQTISVLPTTDISGGMRYQRHTITARDIFNVNAPGGAFCFPPFGCFPADVEGKPFDDSEVNRGYHAGAEHRFNDNLAIFGRWAKSFRVPNVDERVGTVTPGGPDPATFDLRTQRSEDWEAGARLHLGPLDVQWSAYWMTLQDEIHFSYRPDGFSMNTNLDPTRRYGNETIVSLRLNEQIRLKGGLAYTRSLFREGLYAGNDVPLVSRWTGNAGITWELWGRGLVLDAVLRYAGDRRMDNDQLNVQPLIPASTTVDVKLGGEIDRFFWSVAVQNLFDVQYFDYAIASPYPYGPGSLPNTYNAYPSPGRTFLVRAGMTW